MSARKKNKTAGWIANKNGSFSISSRETDSPNGDNQFTPSISPGGNLNAEIQITNNKGYKISNAISMQIIELNPDTMTTCEIGIGHCVIAITDGRCAAYRAWPNKDISLGKIGFTGNQIELLSNTNEELKHVKISKISKPAKCQKIKLKTCERIKNINVEKFTKYVKIYLNNVYLLHGQLFSIEYFGKTIKLETKKLIAATQSGKKLFQSSLNDSCDVEDILSDSIVDLSISENSIHDKNGQIDPLNSTTNASGDTNGLLSRSSDLVSRSQVFETTNDTIFEIINENNDDVKLKTLTSQISFQSIGGLHAEIEQLQKQILFPLKNSTVYKSSGVHPPAGVLLYGAPGTGKSMVLQAMISESTNIHTQYINCGLLSGSTAVGKIEEMFSSAIENSPSIIFLDEIDVLCSKRENAKLENEKKFISVFLSLMDDIKTKSSNFTCIIAATNKMDMLDSSLRRSGRFEQEIEIPIPSPKDREEILEKLLFGKQHNITKTDLTEIANLAHGYVGADIMSVYREATMLAMQRTIAIAEKGTQPMMVTTDDIKSGLKLVPPSAMREILVQVPQVLWSNIGGNADVKKKLKQAVEWPLKHPEAFQRMGISPPRGVLLYGPPGCSKTLHAKALATESGLNFISIKGPELLNKYVGESEQAIRSLFRKARAVAPSIIFFDELDALASQRGSSNVNDRVLATLLTEMDGVEKQQDVIVVAATNRPDMIDKALLRPGRIDRIIHVPLPNDETKKEIFRLHFKTTPIASDVDVDWLVRNTNMFSGAEVASVCREAAMFALDENMSSDVVTKQHFDLALAEVKPQTSEKQLKLYEEYSKTLNVK